LPEVANFIVDFTILSLNRKPKLGIDPACGDGVFLEAMVNHGVGQVMGIDINEGVVPKNLKCRIFAPQDGLLPLDRNYEGKADIVVGNPPFSAKYGRITNKEILARFELGRERRSQAIEILFLERFIQLASEGGVIGIILPSGVFSNLPLKPVREFICRNTSVLGVISLPAQQKLSEQGNWWSSGRS
jgi:type I restriction enzyme M protein